MKPVLFVTGHAPPDRVGPFSRLAQLEDVEFALFGGRLTHGPGLPAAPTPTTDLPFAHRRVTEAEVLRLAASRRYRAVICGTGGRRALPAAWAGARAAGVPFVLWASLWAHPCTPAHLLSRPLLTRLYRTADAVVTYGPHVSAYVRAHGAKNVFEAPQAVDNAFWRAPAQDPPPSAWTEGSTKTARFLFVGRPVREKGVQVLLPAWRASGLAVPAAALVLVGAGSTPPWVSTGGAVALSGGSPAGWAPDRAKDQAGAAGRSGGLSVNSVSWQEPVEPAVLRNFYGAADVLVVPSIATRTFREPWGLVVNEAMNQATAVIASDAVGAAAGGLVRDGRNGLVVPANDVDALAGALTRLTADSALAKRLGEQAARDVLAYDDHAWALGFADALGSVNCSAGR